MIRNNLSAKRLGSFFVFDNIQGESDWAKRVRRRVVQASTHRFNAFVTGPAGTGKRLIARSLHEHGPRSIHPYIPVDCRHLRGDIFQSQLFGKAYAETTTLGCLRSAAGGTVYLANVDALDLDAQVDLVDALESRKVVPVGCDRAHEFDVRVIAGSQLDLEQEVREGRFHTELYRRLCVLPFETTPLASRPADVLPIARHLIAKLTFERGISVKPLTSSAEVMLLSYHWPGNVNELNEALDAAITRAGNEPWIDGSHIHVDVQSAEQVWTTLADVEAQHIQSTLAVAGGDVARAATMLGISPAELQQKLSLIG